jgi:hypothetical protein
VWTVNDPALIRKYAADTRIAAIITDEAARALAIVKGPQSPQSPQSPQGR